MHSKEIKNKFLQTNTPCCHKGNFFSPQNKCKPIATIREKLILKFRNTVLDNFLKLTCGLLISSRTLHKPSITFT